MRKRKKFQAELKLDLLPLHAKNSQETATHRSFIPSRYSQDYEFDLVVLFHYLSKDESVTDLLEIVGVVELLKIRFLMCFHRSICKL